LKLKQKAARPFLVCRRFIEIEIEEPGLHSFRRTFVLQSLRNGCDIYSLIRMMGDDGPETLQHYIKLTIVTIWRLMGQSTLEVLKRYY